MGEKSGPNRRSTEQFRVKAAGHYACRNLFRVDTCRSLSAKRSRCDLFRAARCARMPAVSDAVHQWFRANSRATRRPVGASHISCVAHAMESEAVR